MRSMIIREAFADFYGLSELQPYSLYARAEIDRGCDGGLRPSRHGAADNDGRAAHRFRILSLVTIMQHGKSRRTGAAQ